MVPGSNESWISTYDWLIHRVSALLDYTDRSAKYSQGAIKNHREQITKELHHRFGPGVPKPNLVGKVIIASSMNDKPPEYFTFGDGSYHP